MGVERRRVGPAEALEPVTGPLGRRRRQAVGTVDVQPYALALADVGDGVERIDRARQRRAGRRHDRERRDAVRPVLPQGVLEGVHAHPAALVDRQAAQRAPSQPGHLDRAGDRVVRLVGAVHRGARALQAVLARARDGLLAGGDQGGQVGGLPAARERALAEREPDELRHPLHGLAVDVVGRAGGRREVRVVGGRQRGAEHADLEAGGPDVGEEEGPGRRHARVEHVDGVVQRGLRVAGRLRQGGLEASQQLAVDLGLRRTRTVERRPGGGQVAGQVAQDGVPVGQRR